MTTVTRYTARITTCDPTQSLVGFVVKGDNRERQATIMTTAVAWRWPEVGETWLVRQENGTWYLDSPVPFDSYQAIAPGDAIVNAPTGVLHVVSGTDIITINWNGSVIQFFVNGNPATVA